MVNRKEILYLYCMKVTFFISYYLYVSGNNKKQNSSIVNRRKKHTINKAFIDKTKF